MNLQEIADSLSADLKAELVKAVTTAREARDACPSGTVEDDPGTLHEHLLLTRAQIERLEGLTATLGRIRSRVNGMVEDLKGEYEDAYMQAATSNSVGFGDYTSAKEKDAHYDLAAIKQKVALRKGQRTFRDVDASWNYCRTLLRGAEGVHRDLEVRIRLITLQGQLDR